MSKPSFLAAIGRNPFAWMGAALVLTFVVYMQGLPGTFLFDDFPNIVDNGGIHAGDWSIPSLLTAALSSPSSEFKRPLASLTFAVNFLLGGLDPAGMKMTNIVIHAMNGLALFGLLRLLFAGASRAPNVRDTGHAAITATLWLLLPINLTAVLYIVQRMESLANLFVLLGLWGYVAGRRRMLAGRGGFALAAGSIVAATSIGLMAKETAVLTPLYAMLAEWFVFRWRSTEPGQLSRPVVGLFVVILALPLAFGAAWLGPTMFSAATWAPRNFTMAERLWSEARIVTDYMGWTLLPTPTSLSFYHDTFVISKGWFTPFTTVTSIVFIAGLAVAALAVRRRYPLAALGVAWYFGCHLLTATFIPLELIYEHRNYFASIGLLLAIVALLRRAADPSRDAAPAVRGSAVLLAVLGAYAACLTAYTAARWSDPITLARELANRAPASPRAQYELGRVYVIASRYEPGSPFIKPAYDTLELAARLPGASTLPEQALIFLAAKLHQPIADAWWLSMVSKLHGAPVSIEDESAIMSLATCDLQGACDLDNQRMLDLFLAALDHPRPRARLVAAYGDFAWHALGDKALGYRMTRSASDLEPSEPVYHISALRFAAAMGDTAEVNRQWAALQRLNMGNRLGADLATLAPLVNDASTGAHDTSQLQ
jgi:protein O-mannosyl-transferase